MRDIIKRHAQTDKKKQGFIYCENALGSTKQFASLHDFRSFPAGICAKAALYFLKGHIWSLPNILNAALL